MSKTHNGLPLSPPRPTQVFTLQTLYMEVVSAQDRLLEHPEWIFTKPERLHDLFLIVHLDAQVRPARENFALVVLTRSHRRAERAARRNLGRICLYSAPLAHVLALAVDHFFG